MWTPRKTDFRKLKTTLVGWIYPGQRPQCPSLSPHFLLITPAMPTYEDGFRKTRYRTKAEHGGIHLNLYLGAI